MGNKSAHKIKLSDIFIVLRYHGMRNHHNQILHQHPNLLVVGSYHSDEHRILV